MAKISYLNERDLHLYSNLEDLKILNSVEDVSTLVDTFLHACREISYKDIVKVVKDSENYYYFVVGSSGGFDLFRFIEESFSEDINVSSINIKYLFPLRLSRGIYDDIEDDDDVATSYLDESSLGLLEGSNVCYDLYHINKGVTLKIDTKGIIIGRSIKKADYVIKDNSNIGRVHCNIYVDSRGRLMVHDFDSLNGTFVNGSRVNSSDDVVLTTGDSLFLVQEEFRVL